MSVEKLTQEEADRLLNMLKKSLLNTINFPEKGNDIEFDLVGDTKKRYVYSQNIPWKN